MSIKDGLSKIVGERDFSDTPEKLSAYARDNSLSKAYPPSYAVQPESAAEVQQIVQLANENKIPLIPVSSGVHFYGNTLPVHSGIIMDLCKMNKILAIDERSRMARFEPGVTWGQLHAELAKHDLMATIPLLPHAQKSALTSLLEREPGLTPKFEYTDPIITMEVVLPEGELFKTGSACVPGFPDKSYSQGVNPSGPGDFIWSRLFQGAQGTLGIATWIQCKVEYRSKVNKTFFVPFDSLESATRFVYKVQRRMVGEECLILNDLELAAITAGLFSQDFNALKKKFAPWTVLLVLGGGKRFPADKIEYEEEAVRDVAAELSLTNLPVLLPGLPAIGKTLPDMLRSSWPEDKPYWKFAPKGASEDMFFLTTMNKAEEFRGIITALASKYDYPTHELGFYVQPMVYGGTCHFECNLFYNAADADEVKAVSAIRLEAAQAIQDAGGLFSRPYGPVADIVFGRTSTYTATLKKLKKTLDPNDILSPGRLCF